MHYVYVAGWNMANYSKGSGRRIYSARRRKIMKDKKRK